jgi:hypothetical protein
VGGGIGEGQGKCGEDVCFGGLEGGVELDVAVGGDVGSR